MEQDELTLSLKSYLYQLSKHLAKEEMQMFNNKLKGLEKYIEALEQVQVTRQEFDELKARVEKLEQTQRSVTEVVIRV